MPDTLYEDFVHLWKYLIEFSLERKICRENQITYFVFINFFFIF